MKKIILLVCFVFCIFLYSCGETPVKEIEDNKFTVMFDANDGTLVSGEECQRVENANDIVAPTYEREGYTFKGWNVDLSTIATDKIVKAEWEEIIIYRTITFNPNGGILTSEEIQNVRIGEFATKPTDPIREGYIFDGWHIGVPEWDFKYDIVTLSYTLTAHWIKLYTLTIKYNDGETKDQIITLGYDSPISISDPIRIGYSFTGWSEPIPSNMPAEDKTIEASWKINKYALMIKYNDDLTQDQIFMQDYNTNIETINKPTRLGYTFDKWSESIPLTMPAENKIIEAIWKCDVKYNINNGEVEITGPNVKKEEIVILSSYEGYRVTSIKKCSFQMKVGQNFNLTSIVIPDSVTSIGENAFSFCSGLTSIVIPDGVTSIGENAFSFCSGLTSMVIPNSVTSIGDRVFENCTSLKNITISNSIASIGNGTFEDCTSLTNITIPTSVTSIGDYAFMNCSGLTNITISNAVTSIGELAFKNCTSLTNLTIPDSVTSISDRAFEDCKSLQSIIIPNNVTNIGYEVFFNCKNLTIYCRTSSRPSGWNIFWHSTCPVVWDYKEN